MSGKEKSSRQKIPSRWVSHMAWVFLTGVGAVLFWRHLARFDFQAGTIPQDFGVYLKAISRFRSGLSPYDANDFLTYKYSPGALWLFYFLPHSPIPAWLLTKAIYVLCLVVGIGVAAKIQDWKGFCKLVLGFVLAWKGILEGLDFGQFEFVLLFVSLIAGCGLGRFPLGAGLLCGCLPWFKLPWGLMLVPFCLVAARLGAPVLKRLFLGILLAALGWGLILPGLLFGPGKAIQFTMDWLLVLKTQPTYLYFQENANQSLWATLARLMSLAWGSGTAPAWSAPGGGVVQSVVFVSPHVITSALWVGGVLAFGLLIVLGLFTWRRGSHESSIAWVTRWFLLLLLVNPLSWRWASALVVGAPFMVSEETLKGRKFLLSLLLGTILLLFLLQQNPVVKIFGFQHWTQLHDYGLITAYWVVLLWAGLLSPKNK